MNQYFKPPAIQTIRTINYSTPEISQLKNGSKVYVLNAGQLDIVKIEVVFAAGRPMEEKRLIARCTSGMLKEGTQNYSAEEINEIVDFHGGNLYLPASLDATHIVLFCLTKHLSRLLPVLLDVICRPTFPEEELEDYIRRVTQKMSVELTRPETVAYRSITESIFGPEHPYGYNSTIPGYQNVKAIQLKKHFDRNFNGSNAHIFISGRLAETQIMETLDAFEESIPQGEPARILPFPACPPPSVKHMEMPDSHQVSLRLGRKMFNRKHPDFPVFYMLNTILGGYFGSRLMREIREKQGYTYNIYSAIDTLWEDGYFYIASELGPGHLEEARTAIFTELEKLRNELVPDEELQMVKNYTLGNLLLAADGPMRCSELIKTIYLENLGENAFEYFVDRIHHTRPEMIRAMAEKYLAPSDLSLVTVG